MLEEVTQHFGLFKSAEHHFLVIACEHAHRALLLPFAGAGNHACAVGAAIDQVAKQNDLCFKTRARRVVCFDLGNDRFEQVEPPVNVADDIIARAIGNRGKARLGARAEDFAQSVEHDR